MKTTYEKAFTFSAAARLWLQREKDSERTKFGYALCKMIDRIARLQREYQAKLDDINIDECLADDKGMILRNPTGDLEFSKAGLKKRNVRQRALFESPCEIEPYYASEVPETLTEIEREIFSGFAVREVGAASMGTSDGE